MIKKMLLALCLIFSAEARAQFAAGYAPVRPEAAPSGEEQQSVLFRQTPAPAEAAPRPAEPENIRKTTPYNGSIRILAQVNGDIITTEDINHRVRAFCMTTGIPYNRQTKLLIINKVMQNTIDEKLKAQEAARSQIEIGEKEIDNAVGVFCQNNGISRSRLSQMLKDSGVSPEVFREQLKTDLAWIRVVHRGTMGETITQPEIEEALAIAKRDMSKPKFMLSEIVISAKDAKHISQLAENLRQDPRFELYAAQFSQSPSSSSGGKLGWVTEGQLPPELEKHIKNLSSGEVSDPILYNGDYYIFKVEKKFDPDKDRMPLPSNEEVKNMLQNQKNERYAEERMQELRQRAVIELKE